MVVEMLFGKPFESLSCADIEGLVESGVSESTRLEFKSAKESASEDHLKELVLKSVVGFLNSDEGRGLLILGVEGKERAGRLVCIPRGLLGDRREVSESRLRNWVFSYLGSIPPTIASPRIFVKVFDCMECGLSSDGWIGVVYAERSQDALYYSKIDEGAYIRRGSETRRLSLEEVFSAVEAKRRPIAVVALGLNRVEGNTLVLDVHIHNIGFSVTRAIAVLMTLAKPLQLLEVTPQGTPSASAKSVGETFSVAHSTGSIMKRSESDRDVSFQISVVSPISLPAFPLAPYKVGEIALSLGKEIRYFSGISMTFAAKVHTEATYTLQQGCNIVIDFKELKSFSICMEVAVEDYVTRRRVLKLSTADGQALLCTIEGCQITQIIKD